MATIDERVVSLKMNNKQFLSAIRESASSMDNLRESLKMDNAAAGLEHVCHAGNWCRSPWRNRCRGY